MFEILTRNDKDSSDDKSSKTSSGADDEIAVAIGTAKGHEVVGANDTLLNIFIRSFNEAAANLFLNLK